MSESSEYFTVRILNHAGNTALDENNIFLSVYTLKSSVNGANQNQYMMSFKDGIGSFVDVDGDTYSRNYAFPLSDFKVSGKEYYEMKFPPVASTRVYICCGQKKIFQIKTGIDVPFTINLFTFGDTQTNPELNKVFDYFEVTWDNVRTPNTDAWIDTSAVDAVGLSLKLTEKEDSKGLYASRAAVHKLCKDRFTGDWAPCFQYYPSADDPQSLVRILSPMHVDKTSKLASSYLDQYIDFVWWYYRKKGGKSLKMDCSILKSDKDFNPKPTNYIFTGCVENDEFVFTNGEDGFELRTKKPSTMDVWSCDGNLPTENHKLEAPINSNMAALLNRALLPNAGQTISSDFYNDPDVADLFYLNNSYFVDPDVNTLNYDDIKADLDAGKSFFNLYAKTLHDSSITKHGLYAFPYDDVGGSESMFNAQPDVPAVITINDMSNLKLPPAREELTSYKVKFGIPSVDKCYYYDTSKSAYVEVTVDSEVTLPNEFKMKFGPSGSEQVYNMNLNEWSFGGLPAAVIFNGENAYISLPQIN